MKEYTYIKKRDGRLAPWDRRKIENAVEKALLATDQKDAKEAASVVTTVALRLLEERGTAETHPAVEEVQDVVEEALARLGYYKTAKAYILYRDQHRQMREMKAAVSIDLIENYLNEADWRVRENANTTFSLQAMNNYIAGAAAANYWLNKVYPPEAKEAHVNGDMHIHDLQQISSYCVGWDLRDLLETGFRGAEGRVESTPPKHFRSALGQLVNFMYTLQQENAGAQAVSNLDTLLAPYIYKDGLTYKQVKQAVQEFVFNMNVPTRAAGQVPFTNVTLDLAVPEFIKNEPAVVTGWPLGDFQEQVDMFNRAFCEVMLEGDARQRGFSFPIPTYNITDRPIDQDTYRWVFRLAGRYGSPYFANFISSDLKPEDVRSMCPLHPDTRVIVRSQKGISVKTIREVYNRTETLGVKYEVLHNGHWVKASVVSSQTVGCVRIRTANGTEVILDLRHEQLVKYAKGNAPELLTADRIKQGMYLPFNAVRLPESADNYEAGYAVGAYLGDGSMDKGTLVYSLNSNKKAEAAKRLKDFFTQAGFAVSEHKGTGNVVFLRVGSSHGAAEAWMKQFVEGSNGKTKRLTRRSFNMGAQFLSGILDGWYATDGGNRGRIYTASKDLVKDFQVVCALLGLAYRIDLENPDLRDGRYSSTPIYTIKFHTRPSYGDIFFYEDGYWWSRIDAVEPVDYSGQVYCFAVESEEHLFQLADGLVTHNCRLRIDNTELKKRGGGLFGANPLTGAIGVCTLNLSRLGYLAKDEEDYFTRLARLASIAVTALEVKRKVLERLTEMGLYPYTRFYLRSVKERFGKYWTNHFSTIGVVAGNEACLNLLGKGIDSREGKELMVKTLHFLREFIAKTQERTGNLYNLEATPAEGASYRLALIDKKKYPDIKVANEEAWKKGAAPYYSNSTMLNVNYTDDVWEMLEHQEELQELYTGGTVCHLFTGEAHPDPDGLTALVHRVFSKFRVPYISITPTYSICPEHGYLSGEHFTCPKCGRESEVYSRIVGYYRPVKAWSDGKQAEFRDRKVFRL